ncbi:hypothetical protein ACHAWF_013334 [Thalassiosira exigua]
MLRDLVHARGNSAELEAVSAERDFFREKYIEQVDEMENLRAKLKESQHVIEKLRSQILDMEVDKSRLAGHGDVVPSPKQAPSPRGGGSTNTSVTCLTCDDDLTTKSGTPAESGNGEVEESVLGDSDNKASSSTKEEAAQTPPDPSSESPKIDERASLDDREESGEEDEEEGSGDEDDGADDIRAKAERMLLWANYQTSKRSTPNTSVIQDEDESKTGTERSNTPRKGVSGAIVYSLPTSLDNRPSLEDDDSTLGSNSRQPPEPSVASSRSGANRAGNGKIGKLFNNLRDMIEPPSESESESEEESTGSYLD